MEDGKLWRPKMWMANYGGQLWMANYGGLKCGWQIMEA